jgi:hypothetical protein
MMFHMPAETTKKITKKLDSLLLDPIALCPKCLNLSVQLSVHPMTEAQAKEHVGALSKGENSFTEQNKDELENLTADKLPPLPLWAFAKSRKRRGRFNAMISIDHNNQHR